MHFGYVFGTGYLLMVQCQRIPSDFLNHWFKKKKSALEQMKVSKLLNLVWSFNTWESHGPKAVNLLVKLRFEDFGKYILFSRSHLRSNLEPLFTPLNENKYALYQELKHVCYLQAINFGLQLVVIEPNTCLMNIYES